MAELNIREEPWRELGHVPEMPLDRDERSRIIYGCLLYTSPSPRD